MSKGWLRRNFLFVEMVLALLVTGIIVLLAYKWEAFGSAVGTGLNGSRTPLYAAIFSASLSLFGFTMASMSVVLGLLPRGRLKMLAKSKQLDTLWRIFTRAAYNLGVLAAIAMIGLVFDRDAHPRWLITAAALLGLTTAAMHVGNVVFYLGLLIPIAAQSVGKDESAGKD